MCGNSYTYIKSAKDVTIHTLNLMTGTLSMARILAISATLCLISSSACQIEEIFHILKLDLFSISVSQKSVDNY